MKIANEFTVGVPIDRAWAVLTDLEGIAPCLPGAQLTGVDGDVYKGKVKVKVGPVISEFAGTARFAEKDDAAHRAVIDAKGRDARTAGNAAAMITAQLRPDGDRTAVTVDTDLKISGKLAQFGSGMIKEVSEKLLGQFVTSLEAKIAADDASGAASASGTGDADSAAEVGAAGAGGNGKAAANASASTGAGTAARAAGTINGSPVVDAASPSLSAPTVTADPGVVPPNSVAATGGPGAGDPIPPAGGAAQNAAGSPAHRAAAGEAPSPAGGEALDAAGGATTADDTDAERDIAAARDVAGDDSPLNQTAAGEQPSTPLLTPGGDAPLATVEDASAPRKEGDAADTSVARKDVAGVPHKDFEVTAEAEPLDLMELAGSSIRKRVVPVVVGAAVIIAAVVIWRIVR